MIAELAREYWRAEESRDIERILEFFTTDATWIGPGVHHVGHDELRRFYEDSARRFPELRVTVGRAIGTAEEAAIEWTAVFVDAAGREYSAAGVNLMTERDGLISSLTTYNDPSSLSRPTPAPRALVTGAATGIGAATVRRLLGEGYEVTGADIDSDALGRFSATVDPRRFTAFVGDISNDSSVSRLVEVAAPHGVLDALVNNAAVFRLAGVGATREDWQRTVEVNLIAPALLVSAAVDSLSRSERAAVVNVASVSGHVAQADRWTYNSAKGGVLELTRCQALDLAPRGIRVNSVSPGYIWTDVLDRSAGGHRERWDPLWGQYSMLGRCGNPEEVAAAISFLCSPDASYVSGSDLLVDGGLVSMSPDGKASFEFN